MAGILSLGIKLSYKTSATSAQFVELTNLQEIPELGGNKESIEVTTLADSAHMYTDGLISYGDNLSFKFLYDTTQFETLGDLTDECTWKVELPDSTTCTFSGKGSVKLDSVGTNAVLTYTLNIKPSSAMVWA